MRSSNLKSFLVAAVAVVALAGSASAAPLVTVRLEGSPTGLNQWTNSLAVVNGQTYDYRVRFLLSPVLTSNTSPPGTVNDTINSWSQSNVNGLNALRVSLFQSTASPIQVDFNSAVPQAPFNEAGSTGTGTGGPNPPTTPRGNGNDDLTGVANAAIAGQFWGVPVANAPAEGTLFTGTFTVTSAGASGIVNAGLQGILGVFGNMKYNGPAAATFQMSTVQTADPPAAFQNLALTPEPGSLGLLALAGLGLIRRRRSL